jgi:hypothetical protein
VEGQLIYSGITSRLNITLKDTMSKLCAFGLVGFWVVVLGPRNWFEQLGFGYLTMQLVLDLV